MNAKKLELIGLASLTLCSIVAVGLATAGRTGVVNTHASTNLSSTGVLISNAQASPVEHADARGSQLATSEGQAPIYLDLGAKF